MSELFSLSFLIQSLNLKPIIKTQEKYLTGPPSHSRSLDSLSPPLRLERFRSLCQKKENTQIFWIFFFLRFIADVVFFADT